VVEKICVYLTDLRGSSSGFELIMVTVDLMVVIAYYLSKILGSEKQNMILPTSVRSIFCPIKIYTSY
jgi:hypothetical protein